MKKTLSVMYDRPKTELIITGYIYWFLCYVFVPFAMVLFTVDLNENAPLVRAWMEVGYHAVNGIIAVCIMRRYLVDSFYNVSTKVKPFIKTTVCSFLMMTAAAAVVCAVISLKSSFTDLFHFYPIVDQNLFLMSDTTISTLPAPAILCMTIFIPITVCSLFYAICFAPAGCRHPWLGYVAIAALFFVFHGYEYIWHLDIKTAASFFVFRLPVHLAACWAYKKANTIWAPVLALSAFNLLTATACLMFQKLF